jgi:hypothetical protein
LAGNLEVGRCFLVYKGRKTGQRRTNNEGRTTKDERQTDRQTNGRIEAIESIGLSIRVVSVKQNKDLVTCCSINLASKTYSFNIQHHVRNI